MSRFFFNRNTISADVSAGITLGIESIPDGMANGLLAMVNPIHGVYAYMVGVFTGSIFTSSVYMSVQGTSAMALIIASVPQVTSGGENAIDFLLALSILTGLFMIVAGLLKFGKLLRFIPNSVMTGFINAVAILIILGQLGDLTGYDTSGANKVAQTLDLIFNFNQINPQTLAIGILSILLILILEKTALKSFGLVVALIVASAIPTLLNWDTVALVRDIADIPSQLPRPSFPGLFALAPMIIPAFSLAIVGLVQGAGVSQNYANPDGEYPDPSGDFVGQGAANVACGVFQGMPVGGSLSATSLSVTSGAKTRLANLTAGVTMAVALVLFGGAIGLMAMPALAGLLIVVGFRTLKPDDIRMVWNTGLMQQVVMILTFVLALLVPLQYAVLLGVALAVLLVVVQMSNTIAIKEWIYKPGQLPLEQDPPEVLPSSRITILIPYGSLFFASATTFEEALPNIGEETSHALVVLRLRGRIDLGSTVMNVLVRYAEDLRAAKCRLMLAGVGEHSLGEFEKTGLINEFGRDNVFKATDRAGESTLAALAVAEKWLVETAPSQTDDFVDDDTLTDSPTIGGD
ncbi:MAG: SulP family inorganic anion transporter [Chloroflexi bacterium]|nr:SulP family inorganic anion transporter [Chloroflexota bacterium]